jgi:uncharacterized membrane protein
MPRIREEVPARMIRASSFAVIFQCSFRLHQQNNTHEVIIPLALAIAAPCSESWAVLIAAWHVTGLPSPTHWAQKTL